MGPKSIHDLTPAEWRVLHSARDMDRAGMHPTCDRLAYHNQDIPEHEVRRIRHELIRWGFLQIAATPSGYATPEPDPEDAGADAVGSGRTHPRPDRKTLNIALFRIVEGKGSPYENLGVALGCSANAIKCRVDDARRRYTSEELDAVDGDFIASERRYLVKLVKKVDDPAAREWLASINSPRRGRPDKRSQARDGDHDGRGRRGRSRWCEGGDDAAMGEDGVGGPASDAA